MFAIITCTFAVDHVEVFPSVGSRPAIFIVST